MKKFLVALFLLVLMVSATALANDLGIPVVNLEGEILNDYTNWTDKETYHPAKLNYVWGDDNVTLDVEIKPQGTTSLYAPKKNLTVKFSQPVEMKENWGPQKKYVFKADYIDPTRAGNVVSAMLAAEMNKKYGLFENTPNYGVIDGFPIWVKLNGQDAGIFNWTIPKDAWMLGMDEDNPNHLVLACEGWNLACTLQSDDIVFEEDWSFEVGEATEENMAAFKRLATFVSTADDKTFVEQFDQYLNLDACLNYLCFINIAYANDNVAKNMLMATYDGKVWYPVLYDLDSLWGIKYDGTAMAEPDGVWSENLLSDGNCLLYRVNWYFKDQVRQRYWELRESILSKENILNTFQRYMDWIPDEYYEIDSQLWNADGTRIRTLELMSQLMDEYLPIMDSHFLPKP